MRNWDIDLQFKIRLAGTCQLVLIFLLVFPALLVAQAQTLPPLPADLAEKTVMVYGVKIHYFEAGNGPAVILLHGLGGDSSNWAATISPLSRKFRVIVPDQIGFGRSDKPMINYRVGTLVDFLFGLYKELRIERASLIGNSLGGWTAAAFTLAHPKKVEKLVLVDAAGYAIPENVDLNQLNVLNPSTREGIKQSLALIFYNKMFYASEAVIDFLFSQKMMKGDGYTVQRFLESIGRREDVLDNHLSSIKQPTLIVWGKEDGLLPLANAQRFKKEIIGAELVIIDQCGHVPQIEKPAEFNAALLKFLAGDRGRGK